MDLYHIALFVHIVTLVAAFGATTVIKLSLSRRARARTVAEMLDWHGVVTSTSKVFPISLVAFVVTGSYMLSVNRVAWSTGFVVAGLVGVLLLLVGGVFLGVKGAALGKMLNEMAKRGADQPAPKLVPPPLLAAMPMINTGIALSVALDMVTKPTSIAVALTIVAVGIVTGAVAALAGGRHPQVATSSSAAGR